MSPGDRIGKYRLTRRLGQGAMGVVWAAVNEDTQKEVAVKLLLGASDHLRKRLMREAVACGRIEHRNVVTIYDVGVAPAGDPFLVMALLSGETLRDKMKREGRLPPDVVARIGAAIAAGLSAVHDAGIVHRDLKPENVFLHREAGTAEPVVKLLDFGTSRLEMGGDGKLTATGTLLGSPAYMSPEQAACAHEIGPPADIWSLGVVLFEMLAARRLWKSTSLADLVAQVLTEPVPSLAAIAPDVPADLAALVQSCLHRDPEQRIATAALVSERLLALSSAPASTPRAPVTPRAADPPSFPAPGGVVQTFRVQTGPAPKPANVPSRTAVPAPRPSQPRRASEPQQAAAPKSSGSSTWLWVTGGLFAVLALVLVLFLRRGDDSTPSPPRGETAKRQRAEDRRAGSPDSDGPRGHDVVDPPAKAPRRVRAPDGQKAADRAPDSTVPLILDIEQPSQVYLDDVPVGTTPMDKLDVRPGTHQLRFKHATLGERTLTVEARLGVSMVIKVDFEQKDEPDAG